MKSELKKRWVSALRSGEYKQTKHYLCNDQGWCCLGVLCNLVDPNMWQKVDENEDEDPSTRSSARAYWFADGNVDKEFPDHDWLEEIGLEEGIARYLVLLNDEGYPSFDHIADFIEEKVHAQD